MTGIDVRKTHQSQKHTQQQNNMHRGTSHTKNPYYSPKQGRTRQRGRTFLTARGAFTCDFKFTIHENPKPPNSISISVTGTAARDLNMVHPSLHSAHLPQLLLAKHHHLPHCLSQDHNLIQTHKTQISFRPQINPNKKPKSKTDEEELVGYNVLSTENHKSRED